MKLPSLSLVSGLGLLAASVSTGRPTAPVKANKSHDSLGLAGLPSTLRNSGDDQNNSSLRTPANLQDKIDDFVNAGKEYCNKLLITDAIGNDTKTWICQSAGEELYSATTVVIENKDALSNDPVMNRFLRTRDADINDARAYTDQAAKDSGRTREGFIRAYTDENAASKQQQEFYSAKFELIKVLDPNIAKSLPTERRVATGLDYAFRAMISKILSRAGQEFFLEDSTRRPSPSVTETPSPSATPALEPANCNSQDPTGNLVLAAELGILAGIGIGALATNYLLKKRNQNPAENITPPIPFN